MKNVDASLLSSVCELTEYGEDTACQAAAAGFDPPVELLTVVQLVPPSKSSVSSPETPVISEFSSRIEPIQAISSSGSTVTTAGSSTKTVTSFTTVQFNIVSSAVTV